MEKESKAGPSLSEIFRAFEKSLGFKNDIKWPSCIAIILYHIVGVYWVAHYAVPVKWQTVVFAIIMYVATGFGITGGAHRLWTHRAFKVKQPLKLIFLLCFASAGQNSLYQWVRDHRVHHKFSDTEADPHNANRGLFFSHIGWLMLKKNKEVVLRGKQMDMSDIESDPWLMFYDRHFNKLKLIFCYILPTMIGVVLWGENWQCSVAWQCFIRFLSMFHSELTVNSLAHTYGYKPYNKNIVPAENRFVATCTLGEGWHNYHHAFPYDYKAAEHFDFFNVTTWLILMFQKIGWAYDLKQATPEMINSIAARLGDGTPVHFPMDVKENVARARVAMKIDYSDPHFLRFMTENIERAEEKRLIWFNKNKERILKCAEFPPNYKSLRTADVGKTYLTMCLSSLTRDYQSSMVNRRRKPVRDGIILTGKDRHIEADVEKDIPSQVMLPVEQQEENILKTPLPDGGRKQYLKARNRWSPDEKYYFNETSNSAYGWKLKESLIPQSYPKFGRHNGLARDLLSRTGASPDPPYLLQSSSKKSLFQMLDNLCIFLSKL